MQQSSPVYDDAKGGRAGAGFFSADLAAADASVSEALRKELHRQQTQVELIASENIVSRAVLEATGFDPYQQVCRGLSGAQVLRRLRLRRHCRAAGNRSCERAIQM